MQLDIVVTQTPSLWLRVANWLGADIRWTHALLRYQLGDSSTRIIEAGAEGVVDDLWRPDRYYEYGAYRLQHWCFDDEAERQGAYDRMHSFVAGEVGKRYRFEALPAIVWRIIRRIPRFSAADRYTTLLGTGEVCTSLVDRTFLWGGFDLVPGETSPFLLPDEIVNSPLLEMAEHGGRRA
ncbi:MAG: hypothetical protein CEE40_03635 [Chloroflexi bacterium B3_Chlor]|nr:MAG: hypothetical protein CEE40_03635 [Chloroflexi bacterium B3_Chlor]